MPKRRTAVLTGCPIALNTFDADAILSPLFVRVITRIGEGATDGHMKVFAERR
jgi:hypothetical protein